MENASRSSADRNASQNPSFGPFASPTQSKASYEMDSEAQTQEELNQMLDTVKIEELLADSVESVPETSPQYPHEARDVGSGHGHRSDGDGGSFVEHVRALQCELSQRDSQIASLRAAFDASCTKERRLFERICQLEAVITQNESAVPERIMLKNELETLRTRMTSLQQEISRDNTSSSHINDPVVLEKLNLAYEDLTAIYDLRMDIDQQLNSLHQGCIDPILRRHVIKLVRDRELELRAQRFSK